MYFPFPRKLDVIVLVTSIFHFGLKLENLKSFGVIDAAFLLHMGKKPNIDFNLLSVEVLAATISCKKSKHYDYRQGKRTSWP